MGFSFPVALYKRSADGLLRKDFWLSVGNAKISGMQKDLDLSSTQYSIVLVVFFVGYVVFEVPSKFVLSRCREEKKDDAHYDIASF